MKLDSMRALESHCDEIGNCLIWRHGVNSCKHPYARIDGKPVSVRTYVYERLFGKQRRPGYRLTTRCGNTLCLSPECVVQESYGQGVRRSYAEGKRGKLGEYLKKRDNAIAQGKGRLTQEIADYIRAHEMDIPSPQLARKYGCHRSTINDIKSGASWKTPAMFLKLGPASVFELGAMG